MGGFFVRLGQIAYRFATRKAAESFAKSRKGAGGVTTTRPSGVQVKPGPKPQSTVNQPRSADTGRMQSPKPSPAKRGETRPSSSSPKKPTAPARSDKKPTAVARGASSKTDVATTGPKKPETPGRGKAPMMPKSMVRERPNTRPKLSSAPGMLRGSATPDDAPKVDKKTPTRTAKTYSGRGDGMREMATRAIDRAESSKTTVSSKRPKARPEKATKSSSPSNTRPKANPLDGWSDARRKTLRSDKIGKDAGDGMKWVVGSNSNALVRTRDMERVKENMRLQKLVKQTKDKTKKPDTGGR